MSNRQASRGRRVVVDLLTIICLAVAGSAGDCSNRRAPTTSDPAGFTVAISKPVPAITAGGPGVTVTATVTRLAGFTGSVTVSVAALSPLHASQDVTLGPTETVATFQLSASAGTSPTSATIDVIARATDYANAEDQAGVSVLALGTFSLVLNSDGLPHVLPGTNIHTTLTIVRSNYPQSVTVTAPVLAPFTFTLTPATPTDVTADNLIALDVVVPLTAPPGAYLLNLTATGSGGATATAGFNFAVDVPSYTLAAAGPVGGVVPGAAGTITVNATRDVGFTAAIALSASFAPSGFTVAPATIPAGSNAATMQVTVANTVAPGSYGISLIGSTAGQSDIHTNAVVIVVPPGAAYALSVVNAPLSVTAGTSQPDVVNLVRTNFTGPVTVTATADDPNITVVVNPATATTGNSVNLTVAVAPSGTGTNGGPPVTAGNHTVTLKGTSSLPDVTTTFTVVVALPTGGAPVSVAMTPFGTTPIHLASGATQKFTAWLVDAAGNRTTAAGGTSFGIFADVSSVLAMPAATFDATQQLLTATGTAGANGNTAVRALYLNSSNGQSILPQVTALVFVP